MNIGFITDSANNCIKKLEKLELQEAIEASKYFLNKAIMYHTPLKEKYIYYVKALDVLEPYLSEPLKTEFDRETVFLVVK